MELKNIITVEELAECMDMTLAEAAIFMDGDGVEIDPEDVVKLLLWVARKDK